MTPRIGAPAYSIEPNQRTWIAKAALAIGGFLTAVLMAAAVSMWWLVAAAEYAR